MSVFLINIMGCLRRSCLAAILGFYLFSSSTSQAATGRIVSIEPSEFTAGRSEIVTVTIQNTGAAAEFLVLYADSICNPFNGVPPGWTIRPLKFADLNFFSDYNPFLPAGAMYEATFEVTPPSVAGNGAFLWQLQEDGFLCFNPILDKREQVVTVSPLASVPSTLISPVAGIFRVTGKENPDCAGIAGQWTFCQHQTDLHSVGKGIADADETFAWDMNLWRGTDVDADKSKAVFATAPGKVVKWAGLHVPGAVSGAVLIEHTQGGRIWWSGYLHMKEITVTENELVTASSLLGNISNICACGAIPNHLHFAAYQGANTPGGLLSRNVSFLQRDEAAPPSITRISPNPVTGSELPKTITIEGADFLNKPTVSLRWTFPPLPPTGGYIVPDAQVTFVSSTQVQVSIKTTTAADTWTVQVTNPDGQTSRPFTFAVLAPAPVVTVTSPNGRETWPSGVSQRIVWSVIGDTTLINNFHISYSLDAGASYLNDIGTVSESMRAISWTPSLAISSTTQLRVRVQARDSNNAILGQDISDASFTIGPVANPSGLTIITHGFQPIFLGFPAWPPDMANEIVRTKSGGKVVVLNFDSGESDVITGSGTENELASFGETVLVLNWAGKSHKTLPDFSTSEPGWREAAGDFLANYLLGTGLIRQVKEHGIPIHFIGHSFGTVVNSEAIRRLGAYGVQVDQMTTLDPHDQDQEGIPDAKDYNTVGIADHPHDEPLVTVWSNVDFADNYWEDNNATATNIRDNFYHPDTGLSIQLPNGHAIPGAANRDLTAETGYFAGQVSEINSLGPLFDSKPDGARTLALGINAWYGSYPHSRVHEFYYRTINDVLELDGTANQALQDSRSWYRGLPATAQGFALTGLHRLNSINFGALGMTSPSTDYNKPQPTLKANETVFNGDFRFTTGDKLSGNLPGYDDSDGPNVVPGDAGHGSVAELHDDKFDGIDPNQSFKHRPVFFPPEAAYLAFEINIRKSNVGDFLSLEGPGGSSLYWTFDLSNALPGWRMVRIKVPETFRAQWGSFTLRVEHKGLCCNDATVWVDNFQIITTSTATDHFELHATSNMVGNGLVTSEPAQFTYAAGESVTLTATASDGYFLQSWTGVDSASGDQAQVIMSGPRTVTANFSQAQANTSCGCPTEYLNQCATVAALPTHKEGLIAKAARLAAAASAIDLTLIRRFRDEVLAKTPQGQSIRDKYYQNSLEMLHHLAADADLRTKAVQAVVSLQPVMKDLLDGSGKQAMMRDQTSAFNGFVQKLDAVAGVQLKSAIQGELARIGPLENLEGKTGTESRQRVLGLPLQITNPKINATGAIEFTVTGELSAKLRVEFSEDLIKWTALDLAPINQLPAVLRDERPVSANQRYYRVIIVP